MWTRLAGIAVLAAGLSGPALAHHSLAGYDPSRKTTMEGEVTEFHFVQPHPFLVVAVPGAGGRAEPWRLELDNLSELSEIGITPATFRPKDKVIVSGDPARDQSRSMYLRRLDRPRDGMRYEQSGYNPTLSFSGR